MIVLTDGDTDYLVHVGVGGQVAVEDAHRDPVH